MLRVSVALCAASCLCGAAAAQQTGPESAPSSLARPRGLKLSETTSLSAFFEPSYTYDSNVPLNPDGSEEDDFYLDLVLGLSLLRETEDTIFNVRGWMLQREYRELGEYDNFMWQENVDFVYGHPDKLRTTFRQKHGRLSDYEFTQTDVSGETREATHRLIETRTRRVERVLDDLSLGFDKESRRLNLTVRGAYSRVDFVEEYESLFDWSELTLDGVAGYRVSEKTSCLLTGEAGLQDSDNQLKDAMFLKLLLGLRTVYSEKTEISAGVGAQRHQAESVAGDVDQTIFSYDGRIVWAMTDRLTWQLFGRDEVIPTSAFASNTKRTDQGSLGLVYDINSRMYATLGASYRQDDYTLPIDGIDAVETLRGVQARLRWLSKRRRLQLMAKARYEEFESNIQDDYDQLRVSLAGSLMF